MKMKKNQLTMAILFATMLGFTACSDDCLLYTSDAADD